MSKNIQKNNKPTNTEIVEANKKLDRLQIEDNAKMEQPAPYGTTPARGDQLAGRTIFDTVEGLSSITQLNVHRIVANGAIFGAVLQGLDYLDDTRRANESSDQAMADRKEQARQRLRDQCALYSYSTTQMAPLVQSEYDEAMTADSAVEFIASNNRQLQSRELSDDVLDAYGLTREDYKHAKVVAMQRQADRDAQTRARLKDLRAEVLDEVNSRLESSDNLPALTADQHVRLYRKVLNKLRAKVGALLVRSEDFDGELAMQMRSDAGIISQDAKLIDAAYVAFARANINELRQAA